MSGFISFDENSNQPRAKPSYQFLWGMGFRPFFWGGSMAAIYLIALWTAFFWKGISPASPLPAHFWHGHEMVYGFVSAIVAGFLLTASANWTKTRGLHGRSLKFLFFLWLAARGGILIALWKPSFAAIASTIDLAFIPALVAFLAPPLIQTKVLRNLIFIPILCAFWLGNLLMYFAGFNWIASHYQRSGLLLGVNVISFLIIVIGGRVVPFFTQNALPNVKVRKASIIEIGSLIFMGAYLLWEFFSEPQSTISGWIALSLGIVSFIRLVLWQPQKTLQNPLLLILHLGYFWFSVGFLLIGMSDLWNLLSFTAAVHALTVGAIGIFIIGMVSRVSLGHSGRLLQLERGMLWSYLAINLAAIVRVSAAFLPIRYADAIVLSGALWVLAFGILLFYYTRIYWTPRADGREG